MIGGFSSDIDDHFGQPALPVGLDFQPVVRDRLDLGIELMPGVVEWLAPGGCPQAAGCHADVEAGEEQVVGVERVEQLGQPVVQQLVVAFRLELELPQFDGADLVEVVDDHREQRQPASSNSSSRVPPRIRSPMSAVCSKVSYMFPADLDDHAPRDAAGQDGVDPRGQIGQLDHFGHFLEPLGLPGTCQKLPDLVTQRDRAPGAVDAGQRDGAEDERVDGHRQVMARGQAAGRHAAAIAGRPEDRGQDVAAHAVDGPGPAAAEHRPAAPLVDVAAPEDATGPEPFQELVGRRLAGDGRDLVAELGQDGHRQTAHPAAGAGHDHLAVAGLRLRAVATRRRTGRP